jgi:hypothetical protein
MTSYAPRTYYRTGRGLSVAVFVSESKIAGRWGPEWHKLSSPGRAAVGRRGSKGPSGRSNAHDLEWAQWPSRDRNWGTRSGSLAVSSATAVFSPGAATVDDSRA